MKTVRIISVFVMIWAGITSASAATFLSDSAEWPFIPPTLFLTSGANAVTAGTDLLFWSLGDTITVINKNNITIHSTFRVETSTSIQDMLYDDTEDILYVAAGFDEKAQSGGLQIFDLSVPTDPVLTVVFDESPDNPGSFKTKDNDDNDITVAMPHIDARGLGLHNGMIYLADDNYGLRIIDVTTDPAHPTEVPLTTPILGSDEDSTLDDRITGYKQPDINGEFKATGGYVNLSLYSFDDKIYAFVLDFYNGVKVFDVTDPGLIEDPYYKDTRSYFWYGGVSLLSDIFVTETEGQLTAFVTGEYFDETFNENGSIYAVTRLDVTLTGNNPLVTLGRYDELRGAWSVCSSGDYAYVAAGTSGLAVVDIVHGVTDPDPEVTVLFYPKVGTYSAEGDLAYSVFLEGATLYLATADLGLRRLDVSNPANPLYTENDNWASPITGDDVCVSGNYTYMMDSDKGLRIFDSTEPSNPLLLSFLAYEGSASDIAVSGNYIYIADSEGDISIVNVANPLIPVLTATTIPSANPMKLFISGNVLYIADGTTGLNLVDISDPLHPATLGSYAGSASAVSVYVHANKAYVAREAGGVDIIDVSNAEAPVLLANASMSKARDVSVLVNESSVYALVAVSDDGLKILNVTDPDNLPDPVVVSSMDTATTPTTFTASTVTVLGDNAYVGIGSDGVLALDLQNPLLPKEIDHKSTVSESGDIVAYMKGTTPYLTVAEKNTGFRILYLYSSDIIDPPKPLIPSIDAGCFIDAASDNSSVTGWDKRWTESIMNVLGRLFPYCRHNEMDSGSYLKWRA